MKSNDKKQNDKSQEQLELLKRKKFLNKMAMATAFVGIASIGGSSLAEIKKTSAMMKPPTVKPPSTPSLRPGGGFVGSTGGYRPTSPVVKPPTTSVVKPPVTKPPTSNTVKPPTTTTKPPTNNAVKPPAKPNTGSNKPNLEGTGIKPGNTGNLVNKFEGMNGGGGKPTAPPKPNTSSGSGTTAPSKPNMNNSSQTNKPNTSGGSNSNKQPVITQTGGKPNSSGTSSGSSSGKPTLGGNSSTSKPNSSGTSSGSSSGKPTLGGNTSANKPNNNQGNKPGANDPDGPGTNNGKPTLGGNTSKPNSNGNNNKPNNNKPNNNQGNKSGANDPDGPGTNGTTGKPNTNKPGTNDPDGPDGPDSNRGSLKGATTSGTHASRSLEGDNTVNNNRITSTTTNNTTNNTTPPKGGSDKFGKIVGVIGIVSTVAFLGTSIAGILQGQQSLSMQQKLQEDAIKAQEELMKNQQKEEYEKLAAQLGGTYDPDRGVIVLPDGSELNVVTGIVTYPDGSWVDQNGNLHLPDGSGVIKPDGEIDVDGVGTIDKDGNLILDDGSGYFDPDGNFHPSGSINSVVGVSGGAGYGGMYVDSNFGGDTPINQSGNYGAKAYDKSAYEDAATKASSHQSVEDGIFTPREYDSIVNLIVSSKINTNTAKSMADAGQLTQEQLNVVLELLDTYEKSGKI